MKGREKCIGLLKTWRACLSADPNLSRKNRVPHNSSSLPAPPATSPWTPPSCSPPLMQAVGGNLASDRTKISPLTFTLGWSGCQPCDLFRTHIHMCIPAGKDRTPLVPPELTYHLSGKTLSMLASLSTLSLTVRDQKVHANIHVCVVGWVYPSGPVEPGSFFPGGWRGSLARSGVIKFRCINREPSSLWTTTTDPSPVDIS